MVSRASLIGPAPQHRAPCCVGLGDWTRRWGSSHRDGERHPWVAGPNWQNRFEHIGLKFAYGTEREAPADEPLIGEAAVASLKVKDVCSGHDHGFFARPLGVWNLWFATGMTVQRNTLHSLAICVSMVTTVGYPA